MLNRVIRYGTYRLLALAVLLLCGGEVATAAETDDCPIVYIDGAKYKVYTVAKGDTLYSLSKCFGVEIDNIVKANPILTEGLKSGQTIKIPLSKAAHKSAKKSKKEFTSHTVKRGETLYSISRRYSISVNTLIEDNNVDPAHLAVGTKLHIRRSEAGRTTEETTLKEIAEQSEAMNSVTTDDNYDFHVVHSGETAENIAERFGTTVKQLLTLNHFKSGDDICEGVIIKVPTPTPAASTSEQTVAAEAVKRSETVTFRSLDKEATARVALMLPFTQRGTVSQNYVDFYQGFLMGVDKVRMMGYSIDLDVFDTHHQHDVIASVLSDNPSLAHTDLIVGPVYEDEIIPVSRFAEQHNIPLVSPLANLTQIESNNIFQMSPTAESRYNKVSDLFNGSRRIVVITSENVDDDFKAEVERLIGNEPYHTHLYRYEHQSIIEEREKARAAGAEVEPTPSDMTPLLDSDEQTLFVILSSDEIEVDRILAALASAKISLTARTGKSAPYMIFGNNRWNRYRNIDRSLFFSNNVVMLSTYHVDRSNATVRDFSQRYIKEFNSTPSLYTYRGYDAAVIFISALYGNLNEGLSLESHTPLQTPYRFVTDEASPSVRRNSEWVRVNYKSNVTITTE